ncbi:hypothetical protein A3770_01p09230 [Chloropicon primus]|uniref:U-box domain-containing protein n=2 Tax=Chloropicon primus TaxID=1764295 RepID=A0A5B8MFD6_9CHLO|nr:hypothetical protein A3770_01p09230 [Chloropicon primus]|eukprot:QDZ18405.1 hypothetical protein A3770_01p09230 [Chloropicon primus]
MSSSSFRDETSSWVLSSHGGSSRSSSEECDWMYSSESLQETLATLDRMGLRGMCKVSLGISFGNTNATLNGEKCFGGRSLHAVHPRCKTVTPYEEVLVCLSRSLGALTRPGSIRAFGFGDGAGCAPTAPRLSCFPFLKSERRCEDFDEVHRRYRFLASHVTPGERSSIAPVIYNAINQIEADGGFQYSVLVIVSDAPYCDGFRGAKAAGAGEPASVTLLRQFSRKGSKIGGGRSRGRPEPVGGSPETEEDIERAVVEASRYPLSIIFVGVGDDVGGKFSRMAQRLSDPKWLLPGQLFSNFGFIDYDRCMSSTRNFEARQVPFVHQMLKHIAAHHAAIQELYHEMLHAYQRKCFARRSSSLGSELAYGDVLREMPREVVEADRLYKKKFSPLHAHINKSVTRIGERETLEADALSMIHGNARSVWHSEAPLGASVEEEMEARLQQHVLGRAGDSLPSAPMLLERCDHGEERSPGCGARAVKRRISIPPIYVCPITQGMMRDPVIAEDGYTYEREAITEWVRRSARSPMTNTKMKEAKRLIPNHALRSAISEWCQKHG